MVTVDQGQLGSAQFRTTVEITGDTFEQLPISALHRLICLYVLSHLNEESLRDVCRTLYETYQWQIEKAKTPPPVARESERLTARPKIRSVERAPFYISD